MVGVTASIMQSICISLLKCFTFEELHGGCLFLAFKMCHLSTLKLWKKNTKMDSYAKSHNFKVLKSYNKVVCVMKIIGIWWEQGSLLISPPSQVNVVEMEASEASLISLWVSIDFKRFQFFSGLGGGGGGGLGGCGLIRCSGSSQGRQLGDSHIPSSPSTAGSLLRV